jgi:hypothetical protein
MTLVLGFRASSLLRVRRLNLASGVLLGALSAAGCTLDNSRNDVDEGVLPPNIFRDSPAPRSYELFGNPGDNLLQALAEVERNDGTSVLAGFNRMLAVTYAEAGAYTSAINSYHPFSNSSLLTEAVICENSDLPDAIEELCDRLVDNPDDPEDQDLERLVFVGELQHAPNQTVLVRKLLTCAKELGFNYLAVEALAEDAAALKARGYVSRTQSGPFAREPQMARLLQEGLQMGFNIVNYGVSEPCLSCGYVEEIIEHADEQATKLVERTLGVDPDAKVLVLTNPRQAFKQPWGQMAPFTTSLANHVWTQTEIEPYAIEQVEIDLPAMPFGASSPAPPSGMYMASGPNNGQCMGQYVPRTQNGRGALNTVMVHVPPRKDELRWDWLHAPAEERRAVTPSCSSCSSGQRLLVQAFPAGVDIADRVPLDQALCAAGVECQLVLPAGSYQVVVWSETARVGAATADLSSSTSAAVSL